MAKYEGLTIEIGGDSTALSTAIKEPTKEAASLQTQINAVEKALKIDPENVELLTAKEKLLAEQVEAVKDKLDILEKASEQAKLDDNVDTTSKAYIELQSEIVKTKSKLSDLESQQSSTANEFTSLKTKIENTTSSLEKVDEALKLDPTNVELITTKQALLETQTTQTKEKLEYLKASLKEMESSDVDKTSTAFVTLQSEIAETEADLKSLKSETSNVSADMESFATSLETTGDKLTTVGEKALVATGLIAGLGTAAVTYASDAEESINKVEVSFGEHADTVSEFAESTLENYGIAESSALDYASTWGDMGTSMGISQEVMAEMSTRLVGLTGDLASFKNETTDDVSSALNGIFTGETESLKTLGIIMSDANVETYALANGYTGLWSEISDAEKIQWRYQYVLSATTNAQGDFANTSDSVSNQSKLTTESLKELAAEYGENLLPIVASVLAKINEFIAWLTSLDESTQNIIMIVAAVILAIGPLLILIGTFAKSISSIITLWGQLGPAMTAISGVWTKVCAAMSSAISGLFALIQAHPVIAVITAIVAIIIILYNKCEWFRDGVDAIITNICDFFMALPDTVSNIVSSIITAWKSFITYMATIKTNISTFCSNVISLFTNIPNSVISIGKNVVYGLWDGISSATSWITNKVTSFCSGVLDSMTSFFGINSPAKTIADEVGSYLPSGLAVGVETNTSDAIDSIDAMNEGVLSASKQLDLSNLAYNIDLASASGNMQTQVTNSLNLTADSIATAIKSGLSALNISVENNFDGVTQTISKELAYAGRRG